MLKRVPLSFSKDDKKGQACFAHFLHFHEFHTMTFALNVYCMNSDGASEG